MVLLAYSIEKKLFHFFLLTQLAQEDRELSCDSASFVEEVLGRVFKCLHLLAFDVGEYS